MSDLPKSYSKTLVGLSVVPNWIYYLLFAEKCAITSEHCYRLSPILSNKDRIHLGEKTLMSGIQSFFDKES